MAKAIVEGNHGGQNPTLNFKGFFLGNPLTDMFSNNMVGAWAAYCGHSVVSRPTCEQITQHCITTPDNECNQWQNQGTNEAGNLDAYGLDFPVCNSQQTQSKTLLSYMFPERKFTTYVKPGQIKAADDFPYDACAENEETTYLNRADVQKAIHAELKGTNSWISCSNTLNYNQTDVGEPMQPIYQYLFQNAPELRMWVYSGDDDTVCSTNGAQYWIYNLNLTVQRSWQAWTVDQQVAGYTVLFDGFTFVTVHSAGKHIIQHSTVSFNVTCFCCM